MIIDPIKIKENIYQIRVLGCRVTIIINENAICLVDVGYPGSFRFVKKGIESLGFSINDIKVVVLTHYHPDHIGDIKSILNQINPTIFAHEKEIPAIAGLDPSIKAANNGAISYLYEKTKYYLTMPDLMSKIYPLLDKDELAFPSKIKIIHLPGHTKGNIGLHLPEDQIVIVGDALTYKFGRRLGFASNLYSENMNLVKTSALKLSKLNVEKIVFSHYPPIRKDAKHSLKQLVSINV